MPRITGFMVMSFKVQQARLTGFYHTPLVDIG